MDKAEFLWKAINRYDHYIGTTNTKAAFLTGWNTFLFGTIIVKGNEIAESMGSGVVVIAEVLLCLTLAITLGSLWFTFRVVNPFLNGPKLPVGFYSKLFFKDVARLSETEYHQQVLSMDDDEILRDLSHQMNVLASGTKEKFANLKMAIGLILYAQIPLTLLFAALWAHWLFMRATGQ